LFEEFADHDAGDKDLVSLSQTFFDSCVIGEKSDDDIGVEEVSTIH